MKAILKENPGQGAVLKDIKTPKPGPKEVLEKIYEEI